MENQLLVRNNSTINSLKKSISRHKKNLMRLTDRYEQLKLQIDKISEEYRVRVGRLYAQDNILDIEIIRNKKIKELMDVGISYEEAVAEIKQRYKQDEPDLNDFFGFDEQFSVEEILLEKNTSSDAIRKLWKKLLHKFHPDLTTDIAEKEKRTEMVKAINAAYNKDDISALLEIEEKESIATIEHKKEMSVEELEKALVLIENAIIRTKNQHKQLKESEWYLWTKMDKNTTNKLFAQMERQIKETIIAKEIQLENLKKGIGKF